jgi:hypothetical protein
MLIGQIMVKGANDTLLSHCEYLDKLMWQHKIGQKSWDNVEQQCLNNVFSYIILQC